MIVYRLATGDFATDISGTGSGIFGGRWNPKGLAVLYTSEFISLAILEILANASKLTVPKSYILITLNIPDTKIYSLPLENLKKGWKNDYEYTQRIGRNFLEQKQFLCLKIPSVKVPQENNYLMNPDHIDFKKIKIISTEPLELDKRLSTY